MVALKTSDPIQIIMKMPSTSQDPPASSKATNEDLKDMDLFEPSKPRSRAKIWHMGVSKTSDNIQIKIKIQNSSQKPPASSKALNVDLKDMHVPCTLKVEIESQNSDHGR